MNIQTLLSRLTPNTTVLTPNRRLAATLLKKYNQQQEEAGHITWASADILPLSSWVERLMQDYIHQHVAPTPLVLDSAAEKILWEEIIRHSPEQATLLQLSETADLAQSGWTLLKQWQVSLNHPDLNTTEDSQIFLKWAAAFDARCKKENWLDTASLMDFILARIQQKDISLPHSIIAIGFTQLSPQQKNLLSHCEMMGSRVIIDDVHINTPHRTQKRVALIDEATEIRTLARWAKALNDQSPTSTIGCIVPRLEKNRETVLRIFRDVFSDPFTLHLDHLALPFNISAGIPLSSYPVIQAALLCLRLEKEVPLSLIRSPFIKKAEDECIQRADMEKKLWQANLHHATLKELLDFKPLRQTPSLAKCLNDVATFLHAHQTARSVSEWVTVFIELLALIGWPGERSVNSQEYQTVQRWLSVLKDYQSYDRLFSTLTYKQALHYLHRLTSQVMFQVQSVDAPVQILGLLEAAGLPFDHIWVMGLDDSHWPPPAKPHPFIPHALQRTLHMPQSSAEREYRYSLRLFDQLKSSTPDLIKSYSTQTTQTEARPSPLILDSPEISISDLVLSDDISPINTIFLSRAVDFIQDEKAPPITPSEPIRGGTSILKKQAACAFRAFGEMRLHAKPMESPVLGLRPEERGKITHRALELIWKTIGDSSTLHKTNDITLSVLLTESIDEAIKTVTGKNSTHSRYLSLEATRQEKLLHQWMQLEKNRPPFQIKQLEQEERIEIGPLTLKCRMDRMDELEDGSHFIIDYKTGKYNTIHSWFGDRPDEPQLPLYCLTNPLQTSIAFGEIQAKSIIFKGISKQDTHINNIAFIKDWDRQTTLWKTTLEKLSHDFYNGQSSIDPKNGKQTCDRCHLHALCRVHEAL